MDAADGAAGTHMQDSRMATLRSLLALPPKVRQNHTITTEGAHSLRVPYPAGGSHW